jgi:hypothetical protein
MSRDKQPVSPIIQVILTLTPAADLAMGKLRPAIRPAMGGDSISGDGVGGLTGTITCVVESSAGERLLLGCNHTLAGVDQCVADQDTVRQPGAADGGESPDDTLGVLVTYYPIALGGYYRTRWTPQSPRRPRRRTSRREAV